MCDLKLNIYHFQEDEKLIDEFIIDKMVEINKDVNTEVDLVVEALGKLRNIMSFENNGTASILQDFLRFCTDMNTSVGSSPTLIPSATDASAPLTASFLEHEQSSLLPSSITTDVDALVTKATDQMEGSTEMAGTSIQQKHENYEQLWLNVTSLDECNEAHRKFKNYVDDVILIPYGHIKCEQTFFVMAEKYNHSVSGSGPLKFPECFDLIEKGKAIINIFNAVLHLASQLVEADISEGLNTLEELMEHLKDLNFSESIKYFNTKLNQTCGWRKDFSETVREKAEMYKAYITEGRFSLLQLESPLLRYYAIVMIVDWIMNWRWTNIWQKTQPNKSWQSSSFQRIL